MEAIGKGCITSLQDAHGHTPLHWAAARGRLEVVALLAARRADVEALTFLHEGSPPGAQAPADWAAQGGQVGIAAFLGELQLQQAAQKLKDAGEQDPGNFKSGECGKISKFEGNADTAESRNIS